MAEKCRENRMRMLLRVGFCVAMIAAMVLIGAVMVGAEDVTYSEGLEFTSNGDGTCYVSEIGSCQDLDVAIPPVSPAGDRVTSIGDWAFSDCTGLTSITIPDSVTSVGNFAFEFCSGLTSVTIPDSVTSVGNFAFGCCSGLTSITIPDGVTSIGHCAFISCSGLTGITIPDSVTSIGNQAFCGCSGLTSITIPDSVTSIGFEAFAECTGLTSITIPDSVTSIDVDTFYGCKSLTSITIPDSVTSIGDWAFSSCTGLTSITIPDSVTSIGKDAFYNCSGLTDVYYSGTEAEWNQIQIDVPNYDLLNATIHFLGDIESKLTSASVSLGQSLALNYYAVLLPAHTNAQMRFTYHGETVTVNGVLDETTGEYVFTLTGIPPQCMGDEIKAELILIDENGSEIILDVKESYSVRAYCDDALAADPENQALATLLADLLAYGDAAQAYTGYQANSPVSNGFGAAPSAWEDVAATDFTLSETDREDIRFTAAGVRFAYVNRLYFKLNARDLTGVTVTVNGKAYTLEDPERDADGTYILYTDAIYATEFDTVFTVELCVDGEVIQTLTYSVKSYVYAKQNTQNKAMAELARALYSYGLSAVAYRNAQ